MKGTKRNRKARRKVTTHIHEGVIIREITPTRFMIDHRRDGITTRKSYPDLFQAKTAAEDIKTRQLNEGILGFSLNQDDRRDAEKGKILLGGRTTIEAACRFWLKHHPDTNAGSVQRTMVRRMRAMRESIDRGDMAPLTLRAVRPYYRAILKGFWNRPTSSISPDEARAWCEGLTSYNKTTRHNIAGAFITLLKFHEAGRLTVRRKRDEKMPDVFSVSVVKNLFAKAAKNRPEAIPALTVLFFAGLRPYEMLKLRGDKINLTDGLVIVDAETSKTRTARTVELPANAKAWLRQYPPPPGLIVPSESNWRTWREFLMDDCELTEWPVDVARHTFASAHYVMHENANKTAATLGHFGGLDIFTRHYKALMTRKAAEAYFEIKPPAKRVIRLPKRASVA